MGTSKSYSGPGDRNPLLPAWATSGDGSPPEEGGSDEAPANDAPPADAPPADAPTNDAPPPAEPPPVAAPPAAPSPPAAATPAWATARRALGRAVTEGGRRALAAAGSRYVGARGGARKAARTAVAGRTATTALGGFLADVATRGVREALRRLDLDAMVGRDAASALTAISNALAPSGATLEQAIARAAVNDVLAELYERCDTGTGTVDALERLTAGDLREALALAVSSYVFRRWLQELGLQIEEKAISAAQAVRLEREVKDYVHEAVELDLRDRDVLAINWAGPEGQAFVEARFLEVYSFLEKPG